MNSATDVWKEHAHPEFELSLVERNKEIWAVDGPRRVAIKILSETGKEATEAMFVPLETLRGAVLIRWTKQREEQVMRVMSAIGFGFQGPEPNGDPGE